MVEKVHTLLQEFEEKLAAGMLETFIVKILPSGLFVMPQPGDTVKMKAIDLSEGLLQTLQIFFSDIEGISVNTHDYTTLKSLLNAHGTLERMAQNAESTKH